MRALLRIIISLVALAGYHVFLWGAKLGGRGGGRYSNCDFWVFEQQRKHGGYIMLMPSLLYVWPHAAWSQDGMNWFQWVNVDGNVEKRAWWKPPIVFIGKPVPFTIEDWERRKRIALYKRQKQQKQETRP